MSWTQKYIDWWKDWGNPIGWSINLGSTIYNAAMGHADRKQQQKQFEASHKLAQDQLYRGTSIAVEDLKNAGLHPSLAAGNAGHAPLPASSLSHRPPVDASTLLQASLIPSQIKLNEAMVNESRSRALKARADARRTNVGTKLDPIDQSYRAADVVTRSNAQESLSAVHKRQEDLINIDIAKARKELRYMEENDMRMPTASGELSQIIKILGTEGIAVREILRMLHPIIDVIAVLKGRKRK